MRKVITGSDRGCIKVGSNDFQILMRNNQGDGSNHVFIADFGDKDLPAEFDAEEYTAVKGLWYFTDYEKLEEKYEEVGFLCGDFKIFKYDCNTPKDRAAAVVKSHECHVFLEKSNFHSAPRFYFIVMGGR